MSWKEFESFATGVLARHYTPFEIKLVQTQFSKDGAHDAEAYHIFAASRPESPLGILFRLWVEVKQRRTSRIDLGDLGKNLVRAVNERVTKLIFVTNCEYTSEAQREIKAFCDRLGLGYALLTGTDLLELAATEPRKPAGASRQEDRVPLARAPRSVQSHRLAPELRVSGCFTTDPFRSGHDMTDAALSIQEGQPVFAILDLSAAAFPGPRMVEIRLTASDEGRLIVHPYGSSSNEVLTSGESIRKLYVVWPVEPGRYSFEDLQLRVDGADDIELASKCAGVFYASRGILSDWTPPSRGEALQRLSQRAEEWLAASLRDPASSDRPESPGQRIGTLCLVASAGVGKSLASSIVRRRCLTGGAQEIYFDGELDYSRRRFADRVFQRLFPIPPPALGEDRRPMLQQWLSESGISEATAGAVAEWICANRGLDADQIDTRRLGEFIAALLVKASERTPLLVVFEDLHKVAPSTIGLLREVHRHLRMLRRGRVLMLCTTREAPVMSDEDVRAGWHAQLREFVASGLTEAHELAPFTDGEAVDLLLRTLPLIAHPEAAAVVSQVGRTPFALREALLYLVTTNVVRYDPLIGEILLLEPQRLRSYIETERLTMATEERLTVLRAEHPEWLGTVLDAGACLGRIFALDTCLAVAGYQSREQVERALSRCERLAVVRPSAREPGFLEFDHDLVRRTTLRKMGGARQRRVAGLLYDQLSSNSGDSILASLAFQAGRAEAALEHGTREAAACAQQERHPEAAQFLYLAIGCLDAEGTFSRSRTISSSLRSVLDEALAVAPPCVVSNLPRVERHGQALQLIRMLLGSLGAISSGSSEAFERALTEGRMLAAELGDGVAEADLRYRYGVMLLERDQLWEAAEQHRWVDEFYERTPGQARSTERCLNLIRLAICHRAAGEINRCMYFLQLALRLSPPANWPILSSFLANAGGACFFRDWAQVRRLWTRALRVAERHGLVRQVSHHLVDLAHLDLLEDRTEEARALLDRAYRIGERGGLENLLLRVHLNTACIELMEKRPAVARFHLEEAEQIGILHLIGRRTWRVWSNRATAEEILGDGARAFVYDRRALNAVLPGLSRKIEELGERGLFFSRDILAVANVCLRAADSQLHAELMEQLPEMLQTAGARMAEAVRLGDQDTLPGLLGRHCKRVGDRARFVVTE